MWNGVAFARGATSVRLFTAHRARRHDRPLGFGRVAHWKALWEDPGTRPFAHIHLSSGAPHSISSETLVTLTHVRQYPFYTAHTQILPEI